MDDHQEVMEVQSCSGNAESVQTVQVTEQLVQSDVQVDQPAVLAGSPSSHEIVITGYPENIVHMIQGSQTVVDVPQEGAEGEEGEVMMIIIDDGNIDERHLDPVTGLIEYGTSTGAVEDGSVVQSYQATDASAVGHTDEGYLDPVTGLIVYHSEAGTVDDGSDVHSNQVSEATAVGPGGDDGQHSAFQTDDAELNKANIDTAMLYCAEENLDEDDRKSTTTDAVDHSEMAAGDILDQDKNAKDVSNDILAKSLQCSGVNLSENTASETELSGGLSPQLGGTTHDRPVSVESKEIDSAASQESSDFNGNKSKSVDSALNDSHSNDKMDTGLQENEKSPCESEVENKMSGGTAKDSEAKHPFVCGLCSEKYSDLGLYYDHFKTHAESEKFLQSCKKHEVLNVVKAEKRDELEDLDKQKSKSKDVTSYLESESKILPCKDELETNKEPSDITFGAKGKDSTNRYGTRSAKKSKSAAVSTKNGQRKSNRTGDSDIASKELSEVTSVEDEEQKCDGTKVTRSKVHMSEVKSNIPGGKNAKIKASADISMENNESKASNPDILSAADSPLLRRRTRGQLKRNHNDEEEQPPSKKGKQDEPEDEAKEAQVVSPYSSRKGKKDLSSMTPTVPKKTKQEEKNTERSMPTYKTRTGRTICTPSKFKDMVATNTVTEQKDAQVGEVEIENEDFDEKKTPKRRGRKPKLIEKVNESSSDISTTNQNNSPQHTELKKIGNDSDNKHRYGTRRSLGIVKKQKIDKDFAYEHSYFTKTSDSAPSSKERKVELKNLVTKRKQAISSNETSFENEQNKQSPTIKRDENASISDVCADQHRPEGDGAQEIESEESNPREGEFHDHGITDNASTSLSPLKVEAQENDSLLDKDDMQEKNQMSDGAQDAEQNLDEKLLAELEQISHYDPAVEKNTGNKIRHRIRRRKKKNIELFPCDICGKEMTKKALKRHSTMHTQARDYVCEDCGRSYKCRNHLMDHKHRHCRKVLSLRPYVRKVKLEDINVDELFVDVLDVKVALKYVINKKLSGSDVNDSSEELDTDENVDKDPVYNTDIGYIPEKMGQNEKGMEGQTQVEDNSVVSDLDSQKGNVEESQQNNQSSVEENQNTVTTRSSNQKSVESELNVNTNKNCADDPASTNGQTEASKQKNYDEVNEEMVQAAAEILQSIRNSGEPLEAVSSETQTGYDLEISVERKNEPLEDLTQMYRGVSNSFTGATKFVQCVKCDRILPKRQIPQHSVCHSNSKEFTCEVCMKTFKSKGRLREHIRTTHMLNNIPCKVCNRVLKNVNALEKHMLQHMKNGDIVDIGVDHDYESQNCNENIDNATGDTQQADEGNSEVEKVPSEMSGKRLRKSALKNRIDSHQDGEEFVCCVCLTSFKTKELLIFHEKVVHVDGKKHICSICGSAYKTSKSLWLHKNNHLLKDNPYYSEDIVLKLQEESQGKRKVGAPKIVQCDICKKPVLSKRMVRHMTTHKTTRDFECSICHKTFVALRYVKDHILKVHRATKYMCEVCGQHFKGKQYVEKHRQTHGPRDKQCPLCDKAFTTEFYLKTHLQTHAEYKKSWACNSCDAVFSHKPRLDIHILEHHTDREPDRPCKYCGERFLSRQKARMHERKVHEGFKEAKHRVRKRSRAVKRPHQIMGMDIDGTTTVMIKQEDLSQGQEVYVQDGTFLQVADATGEDGNSVEQVLEIPMNAEQCQILLYPDGSFKVLNLSDPNTTVIETTETVE